jgi:5-methylcytosine-specific restriction enzyme A
MGRLSMLKPGLPRLAPRLGIPAGDEKAYDRQRVDLEPWRRWYRTARWRELRWSVLVRDLFKCRLCGHREADPSRLVCDHVRPHRGDPGLFWDKRNLQTLCASCHSGRKQAAEKAMQGTGGR